MLLYSRRGSALALLIMYSIRLLDIESKLKDVITHSRVWINRVRLPALLVVS